MARLVLPDGAGHAGRRREPHSGPRPRGERRPRDRRDLRPLLGARRRGRSAAGAQPRAGRPGVGRLHRAHRVRGDRPRRSRLPLGGHGRGPRPGAGGGADRPLVRLRVEGHGRLRGALRGAGAAAARPVRRRSGEGGLMLAGYDTLITAIALGAILAYSFHIVLMAGQLSLAQAGFAALGAYVSTLVVPVEPLFGSLSPVLVGLPVGATVGAAAAFLLGLPVLRLRGVFLAIATIAFGEMVRVFLNNVEWTHGPLGLRVEKWVTVDFAWIVVAVLAYLVWRLGPSRTGRAFAAVREDELAAGSMGVDVVRTRMTSFIASGAIAGVYG